MWCTPESCVPPLPSPRQLPEDAPSAAINEHLNAARAPWALRQCSCQPFHNLCDVRRCGSLVDCIVHEVKVERHRQPAPVVEWLVGHQQQLYVEVAPLNAADEVKQTSTGVRLREGKEGEMHEELWSWGTSCSSKANSEVPTKRGEQLVFSELKALEFALRVLGSYMTWHMALALHVPLELIGEARFKVNDTDIGSNLYVPIQWEGRVCGYVMLIVKVRPDTGASSQKEAPLPEMFPYLAVGEVDEEVHPEAHVREALQHRRNSDASRMLDLRPFLPT